MTDSGARKYVFISHASDDAEQARGIVDHLERAGIGCWIAPRDISLGSNYSVELNKALINASAFIVCVSSSANRSPYVRVETETAFPRCPIFPVRLEAVTPEGGLNFFLPSSQWTDIFGDERETNLDKLAKALGTVFEQVVLSGGGGRQPPNPIPPGPPPPPPPPPPPGPTEPPLAEEEALRTFIGPNAHHYIWSWKSQDERKSVIGWHFPAFFIAPFWLAYRKLYAWAGGYLGGYLVLGSFSMAGSLKHDGALTTLSSLGLWAMNIFMALRASNLYRLQCQQRVADINRPGSDRQSVIDKLMMGGRVSWGAALGALAIYLVVIGTVAAVVSDNLKTDTTTTDTTDDNMTAPADTNSTASNSADTSTTTDTSTTPQPVVNPTPAAGGYYIFCLENRTEDKVNFQISYGSDTDWTSYALAPHETKVLWSDASDTPHIRFDYTLAANSGIDNRNYDLVSVHSPDHAQCGTSNYYFNASDDELDLLKTNS